jgi:hypothetical protein
MKVIRFPTPGDGPLGGEDRGAEIDAALNGETAGAEAGALRELRADVRTLAAPLDPEFERELQARVAEWGAQRRAPKRAARSPVRALRATRERLPKLRSGVAAGAIGAALIAILVALVTVGPLRSSSQLHEASSESFSESAGKRSAPHTTGEAAARQQSASPPEVAETNGPAIPSRAASAPGRLQQLGASVALSTSSSGVQGVADDVTRLAVQDGGYVESSHVQTRRGGTSEAGMTLSIPSARLSSAIAALGRIASVRAVNQESQDITSSYDSARRQLSDAEAVRRALLKALASASTQGQIDSLREQLNGNRATISRDRAALHAVSRRAANSQLEVTITGSGSAAAHRSTLGQGLDDAGHVLAVAAAVALIALTVLVPLGLFALALDALRRIWRRRRRESALDS